MGVAYDAMCENEALQSTLNARNRKIREQKKIITELAEGIIQYAGVEIWDSKDHEKVDHLNKVAEKALAKLNKKKKK